MRKSLLGWSAHTSSLSLSQVDSLFYVEVGNHCFRAHDVPQQPYSFLHHHELHSHTMCGRGAGKQHMLRWHLSPASELRVTETSITQPVIKHSQRPLKEGSSLFRDQREDKLDKENTKQRHNCCKNDKTTQSYRAKLGTRDRVNVASLLQHHPQANSVETSEVCGWHHTNRRTQLDGCRWVQGWQQQAGGWSMGEWVTSCHCSL